jgi:Fe2+ or Zn2+ uptake regulation protein
MRSENRPAFDPSAFLGERGMAATPRRAAVVRAMSSTRAPVTAAELLEAVRRAVRINKVTLYRILEELVSRGGARKIAGGGGKSSRFELARGGVEGAHPHLECRACGGMECLKPVDLTGLNHSASRLGFEIDRVSVLVEGLCDQCRGR